MAVKQTWTGRSFKKAVQAFPWGANATSTQHDEWIKGKKLEPVEQDENKF